MPGVDLSDYVPVAERLATLREAHPTAVLRTVDIHLEAVGERTYLVVVAECYLTPDDPLPSIASAWEPVPGRTPYTRDSELQNAETSAWGRAIVAKLAADTTRGIASRDEVRARADDTPPGADGPPAPRMASENQRRLLLAEMDTYGVPEGMAYPPPDDLTMRQFAADLETVRAQPRETPPPVHVPTLRDDGEQTGGAAAGEETAPTARVPEPPSGTGTTAAVPDAPPWRRRPFPMGATPEAVGRYWSTMIAAAPGIGPARFLAHARTVAADNGLDEPQSLDDVRDPVLVVALCLFLDVALDAHASEGAKA